MKKKKTKSCCSGSSLVECLVTILTLAISMTGMISVRYYCVKQAENAKNISLAAYTAQTIADTWASENGIVSFDLSDYAFDSFQVSPTTNPDLDLSHGFFEASHYNVDIDGIHFLASLAYRDSDDVTDTRCLYVSLNWTDHCGEPQHYIVTTVTQADVIDSGDNDTEELEDAIQDSVTAFAEGTVDAAKETAAETVEDARTK